MGTPRPRRCLKLTKPQLTAGATGTGTVHGRRVDYRHLPRVTFTSPTVASVGLTETQAIADGYRCESRGLPMAHVPRAIVNRDICGVVKLVADAGSGRLLGAHIAADGAGEAGRRWRAGGSG